MQATAVVRTACDRGRRSGRGSIPQDEPSSPEKGNLSSSNNCHEAKLSFRGGDWASLVLEQKASGRGISIDTVGFLEPSVSSSPDPSRESPCAPSGGFEDSIDYAFLHETYSIHYSESKLKNESLSLLSSELDSEIQRREEVFYDILEHKVNKITSLERIYNISDYDDEETAEEERKREADEDSRQEHRSAGEHERPLGHRPFARTETCNGPDAEAGEARSSGYAGKRAGRLDVSRVQGESGPRVFLDAAGYEQEDSPGVSALPSPGTVSQCPRPKRDKAGEQESSLAYHTALDESALRSSPPPEKQRSPPAGGSSHLQRAFKTRAYAGKTAPRAARSQDVCKSAATEKKMFPCLDRPGALPQGTASETRLRPCRDRDTPGAAACEHWQCVGLPGTRPSTLHVPASPPRTGGRGDQAVKAAGSLAVTDDGAARKMCFHGAERPFATAVTVHETVDVSTDFRACFTTSRAVSARPSVASTSSNTEITMMNKKRPGEGQSGRQRSVACNTDWSCGQDSGDALPAVAEGPLGKPPSVNSLKRNGNFPDKESLELRKTLALTDLQDHPERDCPLSDEVEKSPPRRCCQRASQRAVGAELHLLNAHYRLCRHRCSDIYRLAVGHEAGLNRNLSTNSTKELGSALLSVLGDLEVKYLSLKEKINTGVPVREPPPLAVEARLLSAFSALASGLMKKESHVFSGAESNLDHQNTCDVDASSSLKKTLSQVNLLPDSSHPKQGTSPQEDGFKDGDVGAYFSQLKLDDKDYKNYQDTSEDWFDATENLSGADGSEIQAGTTAAEPSPRDRGCSVHVGGLCPSVSEADLRARFQKFQISEISINDAPNYRYASLAFKKNSDAKSAAKEMNGIEINGKPVNVRLVKSPGECPSFTSKNGRRVSLNTSEKGTDKEVSSAPSVSRVPRPRPRQVGLERDSESSPVDQQAVLPGRAAAGKSSVEQDSKRRLEAEGERCPERLPARAAPSGGAAPVRAEWRSRHAEPRRRSPRSDSVLCRRFAVFPLAARTLLHRSSGSAASSRTAQLRSGPFHANTAADRPGPPPRCSWVRVTCSCFCHRGRGWALRKQRDHLIDALQEVRLSHQGLLNGLSISAIVDMASAILQSSASQ